MDLREDEITEDTTLRVLIRVVKSDLQPKSLAGATFHALLGKVGLQVTGAASALAPLEGLVEVVFPRATGMKGFVTGTLHATIGGETQCVWRERFQVLSNL